jgi:ribosomal protein S18 acetylase RimI-like enzyme
MIRKAKSEEWKDIQRLNREIFDFEITLEPTWNIDYPDTDKAIQYFKDACNHQNYVSAYVYVEDKEIQAYGILRQIKPFDNLHRSDVIQYQICTLCVSTKKREQGIGRKLVHHLMDEAKKEGATHIKVSALPKNERALYLYKDCGFEDFEFVLEAKLKEPAE